MDLTVYGRQETREDSPAGWPQQWEVDKANGCADGRPISQWSRLEAGRSDDLTPTTGMETPQMKTPQIVSAQEWDAALQEMLVKEKEFTRARDALAAQRRRMPWTPVDKDYVFDGPEGKASLLDLFDGRRQLLVYRAFFQPDVHGWPEHACVGCSLMADHVGQPRPPQRPRHHIRVRLTARRKPTSSG